MKLNLKHKAEPKYTVGFQLYESDKNAIEAIASHLGVTVSMLMRSLVNDLIDGNINVTID